MMLASDNITYTPKNGVDAPVVLRGQVTKNSGWAMIGVRFNPDIPYNYKWERGRVQHYSSDWDMYAAATVSEGDMVSFSTDSREYVVLAIDPAGGGRYTRVSFYMSLYGQFLEMHNSQGAMLVDLLGQDADKDILGIKAACPAHEEIDFGDNGTVDIREQIIVTMEANPSVGQMLRFADADKKQIYQISRIKNYPEDRRIVTVSAVLRGEEQS